MGASAVAVLHELGHEGRWSGDTHAPAVADLR